MKEGEEGWCRSSTAQERRKGRGREGKKVLHRAVARAGIYVAHFHADLLLLDFLLLLLLLPLLLLDVLPEDFMLFLSELLSLLSSSSSSDFLLGASTVTNVGSAPHHDTTQ